MEQMTLNGKTYQVLWLLGKGKGGYSWLVTDGKTRFTLKQIHHEPCDYYQFGDKLAAELRDYQTLAALAIPMPKLLDVDTQNERLLKEYIDGETAYELVRKDMLPRDYIKQVHDMCAKLYPAGLNIDYFPTNFIASGGRLYYIDFECNGYLQQWDFEHWGCKYWAKTPELLQYEERKRNEEKQI